MFSPPTEAFERTTCDCQKCKCGCKAMPGFLVPDDVEDIGRHLGIEPATPAAWEFIRNNFVASEGTVAGKMNPFTLQVETFRIPTIVPAQNPDGRCVFLSADDRCTIHKASPYGCRMFSVCEPRTEEQTARLHAGMAEICKNPGYHVLHHMLESEGKVCAPLFVRKGKLCALLDALPKPEAATP